MLPNIKMMRGPSSQVDFFLASYQQDTALWAKLGGQVVVIFKTQNKKIHFISLFSKILETNIEPS